MYNKLFVFILLATMPWYALATNELEVLYLDLYSQTTNLEIMSLYTKVDTLYKKYEEAVAKEQSTANKILGAAAIGAGGIGGMMLASGLAEKMPMKTLNKT